MLNRCLFIVFVLILLQSCVSYERCVEKYGQTPSDTIRVPYKVTVPRDSIITKLQIDSITCLLPGDTVVIENPESRAKIKYWKSRYELALMVQAECDSVVIRDTILVNAPNTLYKPIGRKEALLNKAGRFSLYLVPILLFVLTLIIRLKS